MKYIEHCFAEDPVDVTDPNEAVGSSGVRQTSSTSSQHDGEVSQSKATGRKQTGHQFKNRLLSVLGDSHSLMDVEKDLLWEVSQSHGKEIHLLLMFNWVFCRMAQV